MKKRIKPLSECSLKQTIDTLSQAQRVLLCVHVNPDGDCIGSLLAMENLLLKMGKEVVMFSQDPVPENLHFLPGWERIVHLLDEQSAPFDLVCSIDASDLERIGTAKSAFRASPRTLVIDHHASNKFYGQYNYIDTSVAASGNLIFRLFSQAKQPLDEQAALYLYTAISTDTGNFSFGQMDEEFFQQMAALMRAGLNIRQAARQLHLVKAKGYYRMLRQALISLKFDCDDRLAYMSLSDADFQEQGTSREMSEGLVNHALNQAGVEMCFLATQEGEDVKIGLRAVLPHDVSKIALEFGGGGHVAAAGCSLRMPLAAAIETMRKRMVQALMESVQ